MRVLLVEDEVRLTQALEHIAKKEKINMDVAHDGIEGLYLIENVSYDVVILDIMLPGMTGLEILKTVRLKGMHVPILLMTARDSVDDVVLGLDGGADDYLAKPFATQELFARIRSLARRAHIEYQGGTLSLGQLKYNPASKKLYKGDYGIELAVKESELIEMFMRRPNQIFTREQILNKVWGIDVSITENNIEIYIHHLRKKLDTDSGVVIKTIRGIGYSMEEIPNV